MREIVIRAVLNGFVVTVGCQTVVFESQERLLAELVAYLSDPNGVEQRYLSADHAKKFGRNIGPPSILSVSVPAVIPSTSV